MGEDGGAAGRGARVSADLPVGCGESGGGGAGSNLVPQGGSATVPTSHTASVTISYKTGGVGEEPPPTEQPQSKEECKKGGYEEFGYKNQGQCIKAVNHPS